MPRRDMRFPPVRKTAGRPCENEPNDGRFSFDPWLARAAWRCTGAGFQAKPMRAYLALSF